MKKMLVFVSMLMALGMNAAATIAPAFAEEAKAAHHETAKGAGKANASVKSCLDCAAECEKTLAYFKKKGGKYMEAKNVDAIKDCITLCKASADLKSRKSAHAAKVDAVCHEVCSQCAQVCKDLNDPKLKDCITSCETCHQCCE
ncbi:MAG: hypothetical protein JST01_26795 [Cyanobacteria bacterium SZAS TMP-1]|nr:hypothetical protein [Cyanobacteria bacterium SZAS TMP-1]